MRWWTSSGSCDRLRERPCRCACPSSTSSLPVRLDVGQFEQVVLNLVLNARDAMPAGGEVVIVARSVAVAAGEIPAGSRATPGRYARIEVRDTGVGMEAETAARIFEPFFTTKEAGRGTGLGLAVCHGIATQAGGFITVESRLGWGASFAVHLPLSTAVPAPCARHVPAAARPARETVLVVEDEAPILAFVSRVLQREGYTVLVAGDGDAALRLLDQREGGPDVLLTDVALPGMSGCELADQIRQRSPVTTVVYMSGYAEHALAQDGLVADGAPFLAKPFTAAQLIASLRDAVQLGAAPPPK